MFNNSFFFLNRAVYEIMWKNAAEQSRTETKIRRMRIACWIAKATGKHSENVILIAFPVQQWLKERASLLHYSSFRKITTGRHILAYVNTECSDGRHAKLQIYT
jgi:hypothetical protein